ncbi:hypothetical protein KIW84_074136 [Lathyrus oleraceus]|nr:hypothetical protein KIW84_074136 [Pisum sativum]
MEVNFCFNHHHRAFRLTSPLSVSSLRTQFLGCNRSLRPPPSPGSASGSSLRFSNKRSNRLALLRLHSPRFVFKASFNSHPLIVVVVVVTLSAVSLIHFTLNKRKKNLNQGRAEFALSPQGSNVGNQVIDSQILDFPEFQRDNSLNEVGKLNDHNGKDNHVFEDQEVHCQFLQSSMVQETALKTQTLDSSSSVLDSSVNGNSSHVLEEPFLSVAFKSSPLEPIAFAEEMTLHVEENQGVVDSNLELPLSMVKPEHTASSVGLDNTLDTINGHTHEKIELHAIKSDVLFGESVREGLYMFYEDNNSASVSVTPLSSNKSFSPSASSVNRTRLSAAIRNISLNRLGLSADVSLQNAEYIDEGYPPQHNSNNVLPQSSHIMVHMDQENDQVRVHDSQKIDPSELLRKYNTLLKAGRLCECVELLKDMEMKGLLDMTKVYHAKFFNICKKQKAVKEAFDYVRLIPNPMPSTFNMLMSVCASSQDSEGAFQVMQLLKDARLDPDCKLYTNLISTCGKSGKVDLMFEVFHKMVNSGVEPNVHTYGALIDGCARAGQVGKAFGAYGILRSK